MISLAEVDARVRIAVDESGTARSGVFRAPSRMALRAGHLPDETLTLDAPVVDIGNTSCDVRKCSIPSVE